ncbi:MAG: hypothetical protein E5W93_05115 [Mesorhizobium sp.]|nr:MAG: hypothetical protein E5W93_05115 [Mesorhizobium sp.]
MEGAEAAMFETRTESGRRTLAELKLADVTERHMATQKAAAVVPDGEGRRVSEETMARREVTMYRPADHEESIGKLVYIAAYLIAQRKRLEEEELATILEMAAPVG